MEQLNYIYLEKTVREKMQIQPSQMNEDGWFLLESISQTRELASKSNSSLNPQETIKACDIYLLSVLNMLYRRLIHKYFAHISKSSGQDYSIAGITESGKQYEWDSYLNSLVNDFPDKILKNPEEITAGRLQELQKLDTRVIDGALLYLSNQNPACRTLKTLFPDEGLSLPLRNTILHSLNGHINLTGAREYENFDLVEKLLEPSRRFPGSLKDQILFIMNTWNAFLELDMKFLLQAVDFHTEENMPRFFDGGHGPVEGIDFTSLEEDSAKFSQDSDWMPNLILLAKNAFVWLDQLSKKYETSIETLDSIPDAELDELSERGITGLWLIGLWERSPASKAIKRICGNPEAEASAYSLNRYDISKVLGGWEALENLKSRCFTKGIRLASDMVPNHTGLDSDWVTEHPDYFLSRSDIPYPGYKFNGPNLSQDDRISLYIEDGYYNRSDAAVVFKRVDNRSGEVSYVYHGNDGTTMPWNDTAQINFLEPRIREEVFQQILHVARHFPIIRFDAAMTLARKHIQRLWFPEPGHGGAIPSRSEYSLSKQDLMDKIPVEFWREVVDRIAVEMPDTLLLAEAFWMMEGYFVRNLGMHRVYNSAFMNLLKKEDNREFRKIMKETLDYDPKILKRFVNFMNNPDEDTAVAQFGKEEKYFGVCTLMMTLPGLPMIGHGQFEGFEEKYGMEYKKAYWEESPDKELVNRHYREIVPLMKKRSVFAGAKGFHLFDFMENSSVNEDVYAFINTSFRGTALVFYNNTFRKTEGTIWQGVPKAINNEFGDRMGTQSLNLQEILGMDPDDYTIMHNQKEKLWYIYRNRDLIRSGLPLVLNGYESRVYYPVIQRKDDEKRSLEKLLIRVGNRGVKDLDRAIKFSDYEPAMNMIRDFMGTGIIDTPRMDDLITMLSSDLNRIRKIIRNMRRPRINKANIRNRIRMEAIIIPSFQALKLTEVHDTLLFNMVHFYDIYRNWIKSDTAGNFRAFFISLLKDRDFHDWFGINEYRNVLWYNKEMMEEAIWWFSIILALQFNGPRTDENFQNSLESFDLFMTDLQNALAESEYKVKKIIQYLEKENG